MPSIVESVSNLLGQDGTSAKLGSVIGGDAKQAETAVETAGPALLGALAELAAGEAGPGSVAELIDGVDLSLADDPSAFLARLSSAGPGSDEVAAGEAMVARLFGDDRRRLIEGLSSRSGLDGALFAVLLPVMTPVFVAVVGRRRADEHLDAGALTQRITEEREALETDGKLGDWFADIVMAGAVVGVGAGVNGAGPRSFATAVGMAGGGSSGPVGAAGGQGGEMVAGSGGRSDGGKVDGGKVDGGKVDGGAGAATSSSDTAKGKNGQAKPGKAKSKNKNGGGASTPSGDRGQSTPEGDGDGDGNGGDGKGDAGDHKAAGDAGHADGAQKPAGNTSADDGDGEAAPAEAAKSSDVESDTTDGTSADGGSAKGQDRASDTADGKTGDGKTADGKTAYGKAGDGKASDDKAAAGGKSTGGKSTGGKDTGGKDADGGEKGASGGGGSPGTARDKAMSVGPVPLATASGASASPGRPLPAERVTAAGSRVAARVWQALSGLRGGRRNAAGSGGATTVIDSGGPGTSGAWIRWVAGAVALVAVLAFTVTRFGGDDADTTAAEEATAGSGRGVDDGDGGAVTGDGAAAGESDDVEDTAAAADDADRIAEDAPAADGADANGPDGAGAGEQAPAAPTTAVPATTEAPVTEAPGPSVDLNALVQEALADADLGSGVTASVADGQVTLRGSVATEEARSAAETAVATVPGVTGVDNAVTVDGPPPVVGSGSSLNDRLGLAPITFRYLSARITPEGQVVLDQVVDYLRANPGDVEIQGHTDSDGGEAKNLTLSQIRAESVKAYLVAHGIEASRLTTVGFGETSPKVPNDSANNKALNRRIELILK